VSIAHSYSASGMSIIRRVHFLIIFQFYREFPAVKQSVPDLIWWIIKGCLQVNIPDNISSRSLFGELFAVQVKALSFIVNILRLFPDYSNSMKNHHEDIARCTLSLLKQCPEDSVDPRKELLTAIRLVINTEGRTGFYKKIDVLLDQLVYIGSNSLKNSSIRPLAIVTVSDLVILAREELKAAQLSKIVQVFTRNVHDSSLPLGTQMGSIQVILNLTDKVYKLPESDIAYSILVRILVCLMSKLSNIASNISELSKTNVGNPKPVKRKYSIFQMSGSSSDGSSPISDVEALKPFVYDIMFGLKTVIFCIVNLSKCSSASFVHTFEGAEICSLLEVSIRVLELYDIKDDGTSSFVEFVNKKKTEIPLNHFVEMFSPLEPIILREIFSKDVDFFFIKVPIFI
jgi:transformation/transcription domain-associated protein